MVRRSPSHPLLAALVALTVFVGGCALIGTDEATTDGADTADTTVAEGADTTTAGDGTTAGEGADPADVGDGVEDVDIAATFEEGRCAFNPPTGTEPRCGTVTVPMDWSSGEGTIDLAVAVFASTAADPAPDPVVYLEGGPGGHALETVRFVQGDLLEPLQARGDVIFFDQRGAGLSEPRLECTEITDLSRELEEQPGLDDGEVDDRFHEALRACSQRLTDSGIDLGAYTSINNAHDVEAIRVALGYETWNLHGISYGTKLGLEVLRQHPEGVRSVVLDSVFPPQVDSVRENPGTFLASLDAVARTCAAEEQCRAGGDLTERLAEVVQRYDAEPVEVEVRDFLTGDVDEVFVEGETIVGVVNQALYSPLWFGDLPELLTELEAGEVGAIESFLSQQRTNEAFFTDGMFYAIECNEEIVFADEDEVAAALPDDPFGLRDGYNYSSNTGLNAFGTCEAFGAEPAHPASNLPVVSDVPALVMAGSFDPVTPVSWAEAAAEHLANSQLVVDRFNSHGVSTGACGMAIVVGFLDDPAAPVDASCFDEGSIEFLAPVDGSVTLEVVTRTTGGGSSFTTVRPDDWTHGDLPGDSYRQASFLDPTQLIQVADDPILRLGLEFYLDESFGVELGLIDEAEGPGGRTWTRRAGASAQAAVDWYEAEIDGVLVFVLLVSTPEEREANIEAILMPALEAVEIG